MTDIAKIAAGLSEAQKRALVQCNPWDVAVGAGSAIYFCVLGFLQESTICDDGIELTPIGLAVRNHLIRHSDTTPENQETPPVREKE